jgi:hypothetical protein
MPPSDLTGTQFRLYDRYEPLLAPGRYRITAAQKATPASGSAVLRAKAGRWDLTIDAPRLRLPPSEVAGCFPAPDARDCSINQVPHVALRTRSLPWARSWSTEGKTVPWMALLLFRKSEAMLVADKTLGDYLSLVNRTVDDMFPGLRQATPGFAGEPMTWVEVRRSTLRAVLPFLSTELPLLAHVREVGTAEREKLLDDDGFVATLLANRLPIATDTDYLAVLVNLEPWLKDAAFWPTPEETADPPSGVIAQPGAGVGIGSPLDPRASLDARVVTAAVSGLSDANLRAAARSGATFDLPAEAVTRARRSRATASTATRPLPRARSGTPRLGVELPGGGLRRMAIFEVLRPEFVQILNDPKFRLPVLHHWTFRTAAEANDFETLIKDIGRRPGGLGLFGEAERDVPSGHVRLDHRSRGGQSGASLYRSPLVADATRADAVQQIAPEPVTAEQLIVATPDGEDVTYATAFEIGRWMAMSRKDVLQALVDWLRLARQDRYRLAESALLPQFSAARPPPPLERFGALELLGILERLLNPRDGVIDPAPFEQFRIDPTEIADLSRVAAAPGLDASRIAVVHPALASGEIVAAMVGADADQVTVALERPGGALDLGTLDALINGGDLSLLDAQLPQLLDLLRTDATRGGF